MIKSIWEQKTAEPTVHDIYMENMAQSIQIQNKLY